MTAISPGNLACVLAGILLCAGIVRAQQGGDLDLRDLRVGMSIAAIPAGEYVDLSCVETHDQTLAGWSDFRKCPRDSSGLRSVGFRFMQVTGPLQKSSVSTAVLLEARIAANVAKLPKLLKRS